MKIIDILNKIANNEKPPKKIVFRDEVYEYDETDGDYRNKNYEAIFDYHEITDILNEELEILETTITYKPHKIEHLEDYTYFINMTDETKFDYLHEMITEILNELDKINEIIDRWNNER